MVDDDDEEEKNVTIRAIISDVLSSVISTITTRATDIEEIEPRQETFTAQQLGNFVQSQMSQMGQIDPFSPFMIPQSKSHLLFPVFISVRYLSDYSSIFIQI